MSITASALRQDVYRLLDQVLATGVPLEIERNGRILRIVPADPEGKLARLTPHPDFVAERLETIAQAGWITAWDGEPELDAPAQQG